MVVSALLVAIHCCSVALGTRETWTQEFRLTPGEPITYLSHAFLHQNGVHLLDNICILLPLGMLTEKKWGWEWSAGIMLFSAICTAWVLTLSFESHWPSDDDVVGASAVAFCVSITGCYVVFDWLRKRLEGQKVFSSRWDQALLATRALGRIAVLLVIVALVIWLTHLGPETVTEGNVTDVGHATGALIGGMLVLCSLTPAGDKRNQR